MFPSTRQCRFASRGARVLEDIESPSVQNFHVYFIQCTIKIQILHLFYGYACFDDSTMSVDQLRPKQEPSDAQYPLELASLQFDNCQIIKRDMLPSIIIHLFSLKGILYYFGTMFFIVLFVTQDFRWLC